MLQGLRVIGSRWQTTPDIMTSFLYQKTDIKPNQVDFNIPGDAQIRHEADFLLCGFAISKNRVIGFENTNRILKIYYILKELLKDLLRRSIVVTACEVEV